MLYYSDKVCACTFCWCSETAIALPLQLYFAYLLVYSALYVKNAYVLVHSEEEERLRDLLIQHRSVAAQ